MEAEILTRLKQVRNDLRALIEVVAWECSPKTEREFKRRVAALNQIIKEANHDNRRDRNNGGGL